MFIPAVRCFGPPRDPCNFIMKLLATAAEHAASIGEVSEAAFVVEVMGRIYNKRHPAEAVSLQPEAV